jgi:hypothetical protein
MTAAGCTDAVSDQERALIDRIELFAGALERRVGLALARGPGAGLRGPALDRWLAERGPWFDEREARHIDADRLDYFASPGRLVYRLNDRRMVKVAFLEAGREANRREAELSADPQVRAFVAPVVACSPTGDWVVMPLLRPLVDWEVPPARALPDALRRAVGDEPERRRWGFRSVLKLVDYGDEPPPTGPLDRFLRFLRGG